jgi:hypothetical protein
MRARADPGPATPPPHRTLHLNIGERTGHIASSGAQRIFQALCPFCTRVKWRCTVLVCSGLDRAERVGMAKHIEKELPAVKGVSAAERALAVLAAFRRGDGALSLAELAERTGLVKSTIMRHPASPRSGGTARST